MAYKGFYKIKNLHKYRGDPKECIFRSLWERKFMKYCDTNESVLEWSSEEYKIPYVSPLDNRWHRYFVDFWVKVKKKDNTIKNYLIEIKPYKQTKKPVINNLKKITLTEKRKILTFSVNIKKWRAAKKYCERRGWDFLLLTEKNLFGK